MIGPFNCVTNQSELGKVQIGYIEGNNVFMVREQNGLSYRWDVGAGSPIILRPDLALPENISKLRQLVSQGQENVRIAKRNLLEALKRASLEDQHERWIVYEGAYTSYLNAQQKYDRIRRASMPTPNQRRFTKDILNSQVRVEDIQAELKSLGYQECAKIRRGRDGQTVVLKSDDGFTPITLEEWLDMLSEAG